MILYPEINYTIWAGLTGPEEDFEGKIEFITTIRILKDNKWYLSSISNNYYFKTLTDSYIIACTHDFMKECYNYQLNHDQYSTVSSRTSFKFSVYKEDINQEDEKTRLKEYVKI